MDWEALWVVGIFSVLLGVLLYIPARWWAKRTLRDAPAESGSRLQVTPAGLALFVLMVASLVVVYSQQFFAPETPLGQFVATGVGRLLSAFSIAVVTTVLGMILEMLGFTLFRYADRDSK